MQRLQEISTIIFDLGEVIVDLDTQAVVKEFNRLTDGRGKDLKELLIGSPYLFQYETGQIEDQSFIDAICGLFETKITYADFYYAWNLMIKDISVKRLELMKQLKKTHKVLVLSNTNKMHEECFEKMMMEKVGVTMRNLAHHAFYSHDIGLRKPNQDIYEYVIQDQGIDPTKSLFLDDKLENIQAAQAVGMKAVQVMFPDQIFDILKK